FPGWETEDEAKRDARGFASSFRCESAMVAGQSRMEPSYGQQGAARQPREAQTEEREAKAGTPHLDILGCDLWRDHEERRRQEEPRLAILAANRGLQWGPLPPTEGAVVHLLVRARRSEETALAPFGRHRRTDGRTAMIGNRPSSMKGSKPFRTALGADARVRHPAPPT